MAKKCQQTQKGFYGCIEKLLCLYTAVAVDVSKLFENRIFTLMGYNFNACSRFVAEVCFKEVRSK